MRSTAGLLLAIGLLTAPNSAHASWSTSGVICSSGSFVACASVRVGLYYDGVANTTRVILVYENLQGTPGHTDSGLYGISYVRMTGFSVTGGTPGWGYGGLDNTWSLSAEGAGSLDHGWSYPDANHMLFGGGGATSLFSDLSGRWEVTDQTQVHVTGFYSTTDAPDMWVDPRTSPDWDDIRIDGQLNMVPEPFTIALLGSGLAAMGGVGAIRRRTKNL